MDNMTMNDQFPHIGHPITPRITLYIRRKLPRPQKYGDNARFDRHSRKNCKNARLDGWQHGRQFIDDVANKMSGTSRRRIKIAKCKLGPWYNVADIFPRRCQKLEVHFAPLNRHSNVECKMHLTASGFERQSDAQSCVLLLSPPPIAPSFTTNEQAAMLY